jgi:hypothetical protein
MKNLLPIYSRTSTDAPEQPYYRLIIETSSPLGIPFLGFSQPSAPQQLSIRGEGPMDVKNLRKYFKSKATPPEYLIEFIGELLDIVEKCPDYEWSLRVKDLLNDWEATAEISLDEKLINDLEEAEESIRRGESIEWVPPIDL